jgi:hypothetical protein
MAVQYLPPAGIREPSAAGRFGWQQQQHGPVARQRGTRGKGWIGVDSGRIPEGQRGGHLRGQFA